MEYITFIMCVGVDYHASVIAIAIAKTQPAVTIVLSRIYVIGKPEENSEMTKEGTRSITLHVVCNKRNERTRRLPSRYHFSTSTSSSVSSRPTHHHSWPQIPASSCCPECCLQQRTKRPGVRKKGTEKAQHDSYLEFYQNDLRPSGSCSPVEMQQDSTEFPIQQVGNRQSFLSRFERRNERAGVGVGLTCHRKEPFSNEPFDVMRVVPLGWYPKQATTTRLLILSFSMHIHAHMMLQLNMNSKYVVNVS